MKCRRSLYPGECRFSDCAVCGQLKLPYGRKRVLRQLRKHAGPVTLLRPSHGSFDGHHSLEFSSTRARLCLAASFPTCTGTPLGSDRGSSPLLPRSIGYFSPHFAVFVIRQNLVVNFDPIDMDLLRRGGQDRCPRIYSVSPCFLQKLPHLVSSSSRISSPSFADLFGGGPVVYR